MTRTLFSFVQLLIDRGGTTNQTHEPWTDIIFKFIDVYHSTAIVRDKDHVKDIHPQWLPPLEDPDDWDNLASLFILVELAHIFRLENRAYDIFDPVPEDIQPAFFRARGQVWDALERLVSKSTPKTSFRQQVFVPRLVWVCEILSQAIDKDIALASDGTEESSSSSSSSDSGSDEAAMTSQWDQPTADRVKLLLNTVLARYPEAFVVQAKIRESGIAFFDTYRHAWALDGPQRPDKAGYRLRRRGPRYELDQATLMNRGTTFVDTHSPEEGDDWVTAWEEYYEGLLSKLGLERQELKQNAGNLESPGSQQLDQDADNSDRLKDVGDAGSDTDIITEEE
ncbi:hypothetical protein NMY22_g17176 [Coprinellus aureogranulatus]|nr:hypothetical protein NMY22_g17176 [Coprinellus aureogranulatus]